MKKTFNLTCLTVASMLFFTVNLADAQTVPFKSGETLIFKGAYYMSSLWADLAEVKLEVSDYSSGGRALYSLRGTASTYSNYDAFFKIRDLYQSWVDKNDIKPYIFVRNVDEGGYKFNMKYVINRSTLKATLDFTRNDITRTSVIDITSGTQDLVSVLYYVRTLDFEKMSVGRSVSIPTLIDEKVEYVIITYKGKENIKTTPFGNTSCYKLGVSVNNKGLVNKESNNIWLTADKNKIPVLVKAEIPVGSVQLRITEALGINK